MRKTILAVLFLAFSSSLYAQNNIKHWEPDGKQVEEIKKIAKAYIYYVLSDERIERKNDNYPAMAYSDVAKKTINHIKHAKEIEKDFTVGGFPYSKYKIKISCLIESGRRRVHVDYFDPKAFPDWDKEPKIIMGGFSSYFNVVVDVDAKKVIGHYASPL
jgi:hypothetical protein